MRYLVDGYNLMYTSREHQPFREGKSLAVCRDILVGKLAAFAAAMPTAVTVVFDGQEAGGGGVHLGGVEVVFSHGPGGADAEIVERVERWVDRKALTVVSSDREVILAVRRLGALPVRSGTFMTHLESAVAASAMASECEKMRAPTQEETAFWLGIFDDEENDN